MADESLPETGDAAVRDFLQAIALAFVTQGVAVIYRTESVIQVIATLFIGILFSIAGFNWRKLKALMGGRFERTAIDVAADFRSWLSIGLLLFVYIGTPSLISSFKTAWYADPQTLLSFQTTALPWEMLGVLATMITTLFVLLKIGSTTQAKKAVPVMPQPLAPAISPAGLEVKPVVQEHPLGTFKPVPWPDNRTHIVYACRLRNEKTGTPVIAAEQVIARISYLNDKHESIREVDYGAWIGTPSQTVAFQPTQVHFLILALLFEPPGEPIHEWQAVEDNRGGHYPQLGVRIIPLEPDLCFVRVCPIVNGVRQQAFKLRIDLQALKWPAKK
jgi:hypothetical protein